MVVVYIAKFRNDGREAINHSNQIYAANQNTHQTFDEDFEIVEILF